MRHDIFGAFVGIADEDGLKAWNDMARSFLAHGADVPDHLARVLAREPDLALAHALKGLFLMLLARRELLPAARDEFAAARAAEAAGTSSPRERAMVAALGEWLNGYPEAAVAQLETYLNSVPCDTLVLKLDQAIRFVRGDRWGMLAAAERGLAAHTSHHPGHGYVHGMAAFAFEEVGRYDAAERTGRAGLDAAPDDAWGLHAVAHVYDMTARARAGIELIDHHSTAWSHCNNFRYHVWWHQALLYLDAGEYDAALALYDARIRETPTDDYRDIANATSLLMRLELDGIPVGPRWEELADLAEARSGDGCLVFADLHYMLALVGAERLQAAEALRARMTRATGTAVGGADDAAAGPGGWAASGLTAFGAGRYETAFHYLVRARDDLQSIGGSHAQRDVFERMTIDAGLRAGRLNETAAILADRRRRRGAEDAFAATRAARIASIRQAGLDITAA